MEPRSQVVFWDYHSSSRFILRKEERKKEGKKERKKEREKERKNP